MKKVLIRPVLVLSILLLFIPGCDIGDSEETLELFDPEDPTTILVPVEPAEPVDVDHTFGKLIDERDGQTYKTIKIGAQVWMAENLNYKADTSWCYDNDPKKCQIYGRLYNWETALTVCPPGWHLPSDDAWTQLTDYLKENAGGKMKVAGTELWKTPNLGATNESGFTGLPGGFRNNDGNFFNARGYGFWWSSTSNLPWHAWTRYVRYSDGSVTRYNYYNRNAFSIRCLKD